MSRTYSVDLKTIVESHNLTPVNLSDDYEQVKITTWDVTRPGSLSPGFTITLTPPGCRSWGSWRPPT